MALILILAFLLNLIFGTLLELFNLRWGLVFSQALFIAGPVFVALRLFYLDPRSVLPLRKPGPRALAATVLGAIGLNHVLNLVGSWQERVFPTPEAVRAFFETQFVYRGPLDFALLLVAFAIVPAICEEILFRGFVQAGFIRIFESVPAGITLTALVFAVFHLDPWRFGGVLILGLFLGFLAHRSGSLVPPVVAHALNNTLSIVLTAATGRSDAEDGEVWMLVAALAFVAVALGLLWPRHSRVAAERVL